VVDLVAAAKSSGAAIAIVPIERFRPAFFQLKTGVAGEIVQKFVTYGLGVAILGDTQGLRAANAALHDFIHESKLRGSVWFLRDKQELEERLKRDATRG
jgi:hypothetical protein